MAFAGSYLLAYFALRMAWSLAHSARWFALLWCVSSDEDTARYVSQYGHL